MDPHEGACKCGKVQVTLKLPKPLSVYSPRKCDCGFCMQRGISYISDANGELHIYSDSELAALSQGSEQAKFLTCSHCHDVIAASIETADGVIGALNATLLEQAQQLMPVTVVSPQQLSAEDKLMRWQTVWQAIYVNT